MAGTTAWWPASTTAPGESGPGVLVIGFQAPLSFVNACDFRRGMLEAIARGQGAVRLLVLEASSVVVVEADLSLGALQMSRLIPTGWEIAVGADFSVGSRANSLVRGGELNRGRRLALAKPQGAVL